MTMGAASQSNAATLKSNRIKITLDGTARYKMIARPFKRQRGFKARRLGGNGHHLEETIGGGKLTVFDLEALELHGAEQLFDGPAQLIPVDDLPCIGGRLDLVSGEQDPMDGLGVFRRM